MPELRLAACAGANSKAQAGKRDGWVAIHGLDLQSGKVRQIAQSDAAPSPSFLAWSQGRSVLYVASELPRGDGLVTALHVKGDALVAGNQVATGGNAAVHLCLDQQDGHVFAANYHGGDPSGPVAVAAFALDQDGSVGAMTGSANHDGHGPDPDRQSGPHCHSVMISRDNRILAAADLGTDSLYLYRFDAEGGTIALATQLRLPPGCGPRHSVFHPSRPFLYLTGELDSSLMTIAIDTTTGSGTLLESVAATATAHHNRNYPSGIAISPDGHYVLAANRNADTIAVYWIDPKSGIARLRHEIDCGGKFPRAIRFDPSARYLAVANQFSDDISIFGWDFATGALSEKPLLAFDIQTPLDMVFVG